MELSHKAFEYLEQGGWVMIPLGVCSLLLWMLIIDRVQAFRGMRARDISITDAIAAVRSGKIDVGSNGLRARLVNGFLAKRTGFPDIDRHVIRQVSDRMKRDLEKFLAVIAVLAAVAPVLGLLGTVLGMIQTFDVISVFGTGNAKALAGGISVALVTTQSGLLIAIPGLILSGMLRRQSLRLRTRLEESTTVLERIIRRSAVLEGGR
ncbi:MAG: MotA/TolQ/ExbB proton channel family protein [bacterium]